jgi:hypothetical protein
MFFTGERTMNMNNRLTAWDMLLSTIVAVAMFYGVISYFEHEAMKQEKLDHAKVVAEQKYQAEHKDDWLHWKTMVPKTPIDDSWKAKEGE